MNPNLTNPVIVTRLAHEREQEMRRESHAPLQTATDFELPEAPKTRTPKSRRPAVLTWVIALFVR